MKSPPLRKVIFLAILKVMSSNFDIENLAFQLFSINKFLEQYPDLKKKVDTITTHLDEVIANQASRFMDLAEQSAEKTATSTRLKALRIRKAYEDYWEDIGLSPEQIKGLSRLNSRSFNKMANDWQKQRKMFNHFLETEDNEEIEYLPTNTQPLKKEKRRKRLYKKLFDSLYSHETSEYDIQNRISEFMETYNIIRKTSNKEHLDNILKDKVNLSYTSMKNNNFKTLLFYGYQFGNQYVPMDKVFPDFLPFFNDEFYEIICKELDNKAIDIQIEINGKAESNVIQASNFKRNHRTFLIDKWHEICGGEDYESVKPNEIELFKQIKVTITYKKDLPQGTLKRPVSWTKDAIQACVKQSYVEVDCKQDCMFHAIIRAYIEALFEESTKTYRFNKILFPDKEGEKIYITLPGTNYRIETDKNHRTRDINNFLSRYSEAIILEYKVLICNEHNKTDWIDSDWTEQDIMGFFSNLFGVRIFTLKNFGNIIKKDKQYLGPFSGDQIIVLDIIEDDNENRHCNFIKKLSGLSAGFLCLFHMNTCKVCPLCFPKDNQQKKNKSKVYTKYLVPKEKHNRQFYKVIYWDIETVRTPLENEDKNLVFKIDCEQDDKSKRKNIFVLTPVIVCMKYVQYEYLPDAEQKLSINKEESTIAFVGKNCILQFIDHLFKTEEYHSNSTILYAHNGGKFDIIPLLRVLIKERNMIFDKNDIIISGGRFMEIKVSNKTTCRFLFRDSICQIAGGLKSLCKTFDTKNQKLEVIPYNWFTMEHVNAYLENKEIEVDYKDKSMQQYFDKESKEALSKVNEWFVKPIADYINYCKVDVESLAELFFKFSCMISDILEELPFNYLTINSLGYNSVLKAMNKYFETAPKNIEKIEKYKKYCEQIQNDLDEAKLEENKELIESLKSKLYWAKFYRPQFGPEKICPFNETRMGKDEKRFMFILYESDELANMVFPKGYTRNDIYEIKQQVEISYESEDEIKKNYIDFVVTFKDEKKLPIEYYENFHLLHKESDAKREKIISEHYDFPLAIVWKDDFDAFLKKCDKELLNKIDNILERKDFLLDPRATLIGGRCETHAYLFDSKDSKYSCIKQDFTSLYPSVCYNMYLPMGRFYHFNRNPSLIYNFENQLINSMLRFKQKYPNINEALEKLNTSDPMELDLCGLFSAKCIVTPPNNLLRPLVPCKINNKLMFVLCRKCAEEQNKNKCTHTDEERSFIVDLNSPEIYPALYLGYKIKLLDVYTIGRYSNNAMKSFIKKMFKLKTMASGKDDVNQEQIENLNKLGIDITYDEVYDKKNSGLRQIAKLIINACSFGKFAENYSKSGTAIVSDTNEYFYEYVCNKDIIVKTRTPIDADHILVNYETTESAYDINFDNTCCLIGSFITSYARMQLYRFINYLQSDKHARRMLYCDTDCCVYEYEKEILEHRKIPEYFSYISGSLGIDTELGHIRNYITKWVSLGPKCYIAIDKQDKIKGFSCKGISRVSSFILANEKEHIENIKEISEQEKLFDIFKSYILNGFDEEFMPKFALKNQFLRSTTSWKVYQFDTEKYLNATEHKRRIIWTKDKEKNGVFTVPFGYAENLIAENFSGCLLDDEER